MGSQITAEDVNKIVVYDGEAIGQVVEYTESTAYVEPNPDRADLIRSELDWAHANGDTVPLQRELVEEITDDEIVLSAEM